MQLFSRALVAVTAATAVFGLVAVKRDVPTILADITTIDTQVVSLGNQIRAFPNTGGSLLNALAIHNGAVSLVSTINTATTHTTANGPFSETEGAQVLAAVEGIEPDIFATLDAVILKHDAFASLPIGGVPALIAQDLRNLNASTSSFSNALIADSPADLVPEATQIRNAILAKFAEAISHYP